MAEPMEELFSGGIRISKDLSQDAATQVLTLVIGNRDGTTVGVTEEFVTPPLPSLHESHGDKEADDLPGADGMKAGQAGTSTC